MTRNDFLKQANSIKLIVDIKERTAIANAFAVSNMKSNYSFDKLIFLKACGI
jgi:hypothetical protein